MYVVFGLVLPWCDHVELEEPHNQGQEPVTRIMLVLPPPQTSLCCWRDFSWIILPVWGGSSVLATLKQWGRQPQGAASMLLSWCNWAFIFTEV